ncbi:MAG: inorganic phosphate transporter [Propionibacteriaceae bacterium]|nr:inorganic phosphate transporter [Propionibacteriaceae bacterium]
MIEALVVVVIVITTALVFDFTNGFHDSANAMATSVATGALTPRQAVTVAAILNVIGAFLSTEVAKTISSGMVNDQLVTPEIVFAGLVGAILWNLGTWLFGMPSSSSHALFGGLIGAVLVSAGMAGINPSVIISKILLPAIIAPVVAGLTAAYATRLAYRLTDRGEGHGRFSKAVFKHGQRISASMVALAHGTSDGQKTMGIITLVLVSAGYQESGTRPYFWVILAAGLAIGLGTYSGGWRIMRTMGRGLVDIDSPQGFAAETSSTAAILASSHLGFGLSTTHVASGSILGSGIGRRTPVRWNTAVRMGVAWLLTLPAAGLIGGLAALMVKLGFGGLMLALAMLIGVSGYFFWISLRNRVHAGNVNDSRDVHVAVRGNSGEPAS